MFPRFNRLHGLFSVALKGGRAMNFPVVLINLFSVPEGKEEEALNEDVRCEGWGMRW